MAYGRMISKDFWVSGEFYEKPYWLQVLVGAMISSSDDDGCIRANASWLRTRYVMKARRQWVPSCHDVEAALSDLCLAGVMRVVERKGVSHYQFTTFHAHQRLKSTRKGREEKRREEKGSEHPIFEKRRRARAEALNGDGLDD